MKNNQFRAHITKYIQEIYRKQQTAITIDLDSNTRIAYLYSNMTQQCLGTLRLYFSNEFVNISYSKTSEKVCKIGNTQESKQFDYCQLYNAKRFIDKAILFFIHGK